MTAAPCTPRLDVFAPLHKALRALMSDTLARLGRLDVHDHGEQLAVIAQAQRFLKLLRQHERLEDEHLLPAVETRWAAQVQRALQAHALQHEAIDGLHDLIEELLAAGAAQRADTAHALYLAWARLVALVLDHMHHEETWLNEALWASCGDHDLWARVQQAAAGLCEADRALWLDCYAAAAAPIDIALLLRGVRERAPAGACDSTQRRLREALGADRWARVLDAARRLPVRVAVA